MEPEKLVQAYEVEVEFADVSGVELLLMLMRRSELAQVKLSLPLQQRVLLADRRLLAQAQVFYATMQEIVDLPLERQQRQMPLSHWWWYLDVIAQLATSFDMSVVRPAERVSAWVAA